MSHLSRRYTDYFYRVEKRKKGEHLIKVPYMKRAEFMLMYPMATLPGPSAIFPCEHEVRDFLSKKARRGNRAKFRRKNRRNARIKAKKAS